MVQESKNTLSPASLARLVLASLGLLVRLVRSGQ
jgi:hypothetical protein